MSRTITESLIRRFFEAFNAFDHEAMLACLAEDFVHDPNQGTREIGADKYRWFLAERARHFDEKAADLAVMCDDSGIHAAAEYTLRGTYLKTVPGLPEARGQRYSIPAGSFFEIEEGRIARIATHFSLPALALELARG